MFILPQKSPNVNPFTVRLSSKSLLRNTVPMILDRNDMLWGGEAAKRSPHYCPTA